MISFNKVLHSHKRSEVKPDRTLPALHGLPPFFRWPLCKVPSHSLTSPQGSEQTICIDLNTLLPPPSVSKETFLKTPAWAKFSCPTFLPEVCSSRLQHLPHSMLNELTHLPKRQTNPLACQAKMVGKKIAFYSQHELICYYLGSHLNRASTNLIIAN